MVFDVRRSRSRKKKTPIDLFRPVAAAAAAVSFSNNKRLRRDGGGGDEQICRALCTKLLLCFF